MAVDLDHLLATFLEEADEHLAELEKGLLCVDENEPDLELLNTIFRAAHSIKGGSGVFGFDAITRLTHALEQLLDKLRKGVLPATRERIDLLLRAADGLVSLIAAARSDPDAPAEEPVALIGELAEAAEAGDAAPAAPPPRVAPAISPRPSGPRNWLVRIRPGPRLITDGMDPLLLLRNLSKRGKPVSVRANLDQLPSIESLEPSHCFLSWDVVLQTEEAPESLRQVFQFVEDECAVEVTDPLRSGDLTDHLESFRTLLAEYELAYGQLLGWVANRLPELRRIITGSAEAPN